MRKALHRGGHFEDIFQVRRLPFAQQPLGHADGMWRVGGDLVRHLACSSHQICIIHDFGHKADAQRLCRVNGFAGQRKLGRFGKTDNARQKPCTAITRRNAKAHKALREFG